MIAEVLNNPTTVYADLTPLGVTLHTLEEAIAHYLGWRMDRTQWSADELARIRKHRNRGYNQYLHPPALIQGKPAHQWSWRRPVDTFAVWPSYAITSGTTITTLAAVNGLVTMTTSTAFFQPSMVGKTMLLPLGLPVYGEENRSVVLARYLSPTQAMFVGTPWTPAAATFSMTANGDYDLPADFGGIDGPLRFGPDEGWTEVDIIGIGQILQARSRNMGATKPQAAAIVPKRTDQSAPNRFVLMLPSPPDKVYQLSYRYFPNKGELTESNPYPQGMHIPANAELLIESCLAVAERDENDERGQHSAEFERLLVAAIAADERIATPEVLGPIYDRQIWSTPQRGNRRELAMANSGYIVTQNGIAWGT